MLTRTRSDKQLRAKLERFGYDPEDVAEMDRDELEAAVVQGEPQSKLRKANVTERKLDGGEQWANAQLQVPGHPPVRFDEEGIGWITTIYDGTEIDITHVVRESTVTVTDTVRTRKVDVEK